MSIQTLCGIILIKIAVTGIIQLEGIGMKRMIVVNHCVVLRDLVQLGKDPVALIKTVR